MREIKFRAWDKDRKCFFPCIVGNTDIKDNNWICPLTFGEVNGVKDWYHNDTCEVMQYTGLKDKNGKEIYEGDIVKVWEPFNVSQVAVVKFNDGCFDIVGKTLTFRDYLKCFVANKSIEVIGNIYENPELLKGV